MNVNDYSLERFARSYRAEREIDAARARLAAKARPHPKGPRPFMVLLSWWLRVTALLMRYPVDPRRVTSRLAAIGMPAVVPGVSGSSQRGVDGGR
jgi:hypothetical protein